MMADEPEDHASYGWDYESTRRRQQLAGAAMTPAERLRWLEEMLDELLPLVGKATATTSRDDEMPAGG